MDEKELKAWFENIRSILEEAYLAHPADKPWRGSGMSGPKERWDTLRRPVAGCLDRSGSFLDIGCANGYLLECLLGWTAERGLQIDPHGLDISARLVERARARLPQYADQIYRGNAFEWIPPRRFDFVRTELVYIPGEYERVYVERLLEHFVAPGGALLIANYLEAHPNPESGLLPGSQPTRYLLERLEELGIPWTRVCDGHDPIKNRRVRVVVVDHGAL
jgi:SAM-dependent methyltransferase